MDLKVLQEKHEKFKSFINNLDQNKEAVSLDLIVYMLDDLGIEFEKLSKNYFNSIISVKPECIQCSHLNPNASDSYRCAALGTCPGVSLSNKYKQQILNELI